MENVQFKSHSGAVDLLRSEYAKLLKQHAELEKKYEVLMVRMTSQDKDLIALARLEELERIGTFAHISDQQRLGFGDFCREIAKMPAQAGAALQRIFIASWERAYWYGFYNASTRT